jgi:hypothetical protein
MEYVKSKQQADMMSRPTAPSPAPLALVVKGRARGIKRAYKTGPGYGPRQRRPVHGVFGGMGYVRDRVDHVVPDGKYGLVTTFRGVGCMAVFGGNRGSSLSAIYSQ